MRLEHSGLHVSHYWGHIRVGAGVRGDDGSGEPVCGGTRRKAASGKCKYQLVCIGKKIRRELHVERDGGGGLRLP